MRRPSIFLREGIPTAIRPDGTLDRTHAPDISTERKRELYVAMLRTRVIDGRLERLQRQGRIGFHIGSLGEEASILGSAMAMGAQDWIFPCYREFGALLSRGFPLQSYVDNMFANANDIVKGRQMPDHYTSRAHRFGSVSSPIGTQISQAVGFAWAAKLKRDPITVAVYFGDGATSSHDFHTGLNFAGVYGAPVLFLCRNNQWAISLPSNEQTASQNFAEKASSYGVAAKRCDGNDVLATYHTITEALGYIQREKKPMMIEMLTYRMGGHSTSDDPRAYRVDDEVDRWAKTDPLVRMRRHLEHLGGWNETDESEAKQAVEQELSQCIERAEAAPPPELDTMFDDVYQTRPPHLQQQASQLIHGPRAVDPHLR